MGIAVAARIDISIGTSPRRLPRIVLEWWILWTMVARLLVGSCHGWPIQVQVRKLSRIVPVSKSHDTTIPWTSLVQKQILQTDQTEEPSVSPRSYGQGYALHTITRHCTSLLLGWMILGLGTATSSYAFDYSSPLSTFSKDNLSTNISKTAKVHEWDLLNGSVQLPDPIRLNYRDRHTGVEQAITLTNPELVGAGGGGAVFVFDTLYQLDDDRDDSNHPQQEQQPPLLLKVSWEGTFKTVQRECATLQLLEDRQVQAAERCLGTFPYPAMGVKTDPVVRTMILVSPYMRDAVASIDEVDNPNAQTVAVDQIARNLVQMLAANVITIDVQPLISKSTGQTIFIDMTEAQTLSSSMTAEPRTMSNLLQQTLISSYISEMVALIPLQYWKMAQASISNELEFIYQRQPDGPDLVTTLRSLLEEQTPFFDDS